MTNINQQKVIFIISMTCQVEERVATSFSFQLGRVAASGKRGFAGKTGAPARAIQRIVFLKTSRSFSQWDGSSVNSFPVKGVFKYSL